MRTSTAIALFIATFSALSCQPDRPEPSARLRRPSGLAYATREAPSPAERADLYIADSEAQGVRVLQLAKDFDANGQEVFDTEFLPAPAVFFPLVIPTNGFPTRIALSESQNRAYVIAPLTETLYVIDTRSLPLGASPTDEGSTVTASVSLKGGPMEGTLLPVGVAVVPGFRTQDDTTDVVLVAFDVVDRAEGLLKLFRFDVQGTTVTPNRMATETVTVGPGPRDLDVTERTVLVTSVVTSSVSLVSIGDAAPYLGTPQPVDVGGPTANVIDAGSVGFFVTRIDRPSVVLFEQTLGTLVRSTRRFESPYTPQIERTSTAALGRLDFETSNVVTGASGELRAFDLEDGAGFVNLLPESAGGAVTAFAHLNGRMTFLFGSELATFEQSTVARVTSFEDAVYIKECPTSTASACTTTEQPNPMCDPAIIVGDTSVDQYVRATYRGSLAYEKGGSVQKLPDTGDRFVVRLTDTSVRAFEDRGITIGDRALLSLEHPKDCGDTNSEYVDFVVTGTIAGVGGSTFDIEIPTSTSTAQSCVSAWAVFSYDVYPSADVVVVALYDRTDLGIRSILELVPVVRTGSIASARITQVVNATMEIDGDFECTESVVQSAPCLNDLDCYDGTACVQSNLCLSRCLSAECLPAASGCTAQYPVRRCSSIELVVTRTAPYIIDLTSGSGFDIGSPEDVVFSPQRRSFMVSFPGAREIAEASNENVDTSRNDPRVRHIR